MKRKLSIPVLMLALSISFVGITNAQSADTNSAPPPFMQGQHDFGFGFGGRDGMGSLFSQTVLDATGLTATELRDALQNGSTLADLITANDGDVDAVITSLVAEQTDRINQSVTDGRITQEQADTLISELETHITARINGDFTQLPMDGFGFGARDGIGLPFSQTVLDATGLTATELRDALQNGSTLADLITANDGDVDAVIASLVAEQTDRINQLVTDGRMTQEQADALISDLETHITDMLNGTMPMNPMNGRQGFDGRGPRGNGGGFPGGGPNGQNPANGAGVGPLTNPGSSS